MLSLGRLRVLGLVLAAAALHCGAQPASAVRIMVYNTLRYPGLSIEVLRLLADGKTVFIGIEGLQPIHQMEIKIDLEDTNGNELVTTIHNTVHVLK